MKEGKAAGGKEDRRENNTHTDTCGARNNSRDYQQPQCCHKIHTQTQTVVSHKEPNNTSHHYYYHTESAHHLSRDIPSRNYEMVARAREMTLECSSVSPPAQPSPAWNLFRIVWL